MSPLASIRQQLRQAGYPVTDLTPASALGWIEASFCHRGVQVTLVLPDEQATALAFGRLFDWAVNAPEAK